MKLKLLFFIIVILSFRCSETSMNKDIPKINILKAYNSKHQVKLSEIASSIEYVPLETSKNCLINRFPNIYANNKFIVIKAFEQILVFNRITGEFVKQLGHYGKSPGGYGYVNRKMIPNFKYNYSVIAEDWDYNLIEYDIKTGKYRKRIKFDKTLHADIFYRINDTTLLLYYHYWAPKDKTGLALVNNNGDIVSPITNYRIQIAGNVNGVVRSAQGEIFHLKQKLFFKEYFNDTLYTLNNERLKPIYVLNTENHKPLPNFKKKEFKTHNHNEDYNLRWFCTSSRFIFFTLWYNNMFYTSVIDKKTNELKITYSKTPYFKFDNYFNYYSFINDIDNFIDFIPKYIDDQDYAIALLEAYEITEWFEKNPEKAKNLPLRLQKLKNVKETDNPVVMIVKLKKQTRL